MIGRNRDVGALALVAVITFGVASYFASRRLVVVLWTVAGSGIVFGGLVVIAATLRRAYGSPRPHRMNPEMIGAFLFALAAQVSLWVFEGPDALSGGLAAVCLALLGVGLLLDRRSHGDDSDDDGP